MQQTQPTWAKNIDWKDIYPRLLLEAAYLTRGRPGRPHLTEDILHEAIRLSFWQRPWNSQQHTYFQHVRGIMRSLLHANFNSAHARNTSEMDDTVVQFPDPRPTPEQILIYQTEEQNLLDYVGGRNREARTLATMILQFQYKTSKEIAQQMNVTQNRIDYVKRQLKNLVIDYIKSEPSCSDSPARRLVSKLNGED